MSSLHEVQQAFAEGLLGDSNGVRAHIRNGRFTPERCLRVYRNNVRTTLTGALGDIHPVVRRLVGEEFFGYAAEHYLRLHPPASANLHEFGSRFAAFLESFAPAATLIYLPDVARLEWAWHESFHAPDAQALSLSALAQVSPDDLPRLRFRLHPSARLLASPYPVLRIWQVNQPDFEGEPTVDLGEGDCRMLVVRHHLSVDIDTPSDAEFALLSSFAAGRTLEEAATAVVTREPGVDFASLLRRYMADEVIVSFSI